MALHSASVVQQDVDRMKARSTMVSTHRDDGSRLSSSLPQATLFQGISGSPRPSTNAPPSSNNPRRGESTLDQSTLTRRTATPRQLYENQKPLLRRLRESKDHRNINFHSSLSQPVLVKSYNPETDAAQRSTNMQNPAGQQVDLPSVEEFGIEAILRAIEPDIRSTLDSIAEICGRSKLSLANEYDSHIAPFGEIPPPSGELLAIQENATSDPESSTYTDGHIIIADDENDLYGSPSGLLADLQQTAFATGYQRPIRVETRDPRANQTRPGQPLKNASRPPVTSVSRIEEFAATSKPGSKALLGNIPATTKTAKTASTMASPALLSEIHLDAQGNRSSWPSEPPDTPRGSPMLPASTFIADRNGRKRNTTVDGASLVADVQDWLSWLKMVIQREHTTQQTFGSPPHSAEHSLRSLLVRDQDPAIAVPTV